MPYLYGFWRFANAYIEYIEARDIFNKFVLRIMRDIQLEYNICFGIFA